MIIDALLQFSDEQAVTATAASTNYVDLRQAKPDMGLWEKQLHVVVCPTTALAGTGAKLTVEIQDCDTATGTYTTIQTTGPIDIAKITSVKPLAIPMPKEHRQFIKLKYTVTGTISEGAVSAYLTDCIQANTGWMPEK